MTTAGDVLAVAAGAERSRRTAWAKYYEGRRAHTETLARTTALLGAIADRFERRGAPTADERLVAAAFAVAWPWQERNIDDALEDVYWTAYRDANEELVQRVGTYSGVGWPTSGRWCR